MDIVVINEYSDSVLMALNDLMPQLSPNFGALTPDDLKEILNSESSILLMARENTDYCGSLTLVYYRIPSGLRACVEDVVVHDNFRGKGVGERLVRHAVELATRANVKSIDLTARSSRVAAISLYEKIGFKNRETNAYRFSGE